MRDIINPAAINDRSWIWLFVNILIPTIGVLFLNWNLFGLLYIFWAELVFLGGFGLLKMLISKGDILIARVVFSVFFSILYMALLMIVISFSLVSLDFDALFNFGGAVQVQNLGLNWSLAALLISFTIEFFNNFIFSEKYKTQLSLIEAFKTFAYTLPLACVILFAIIPLSERIPSMQINTFVILGIVLVKAVLDFIIKKGSQYFEKNNTTEDIII